MSNQIAVARICLAMFALSVSVATAATQSGQRPDPADPGAVARAVNYASAFSDYTPFREQEIRSWKEVNQEVADNPGMGSMGSMKDMPGRKGTAGHDMGSMKGMPGKPTLAMAKPQTAPGQPANAQTITGTGVVQGIDRANGKVKLTHDPIAALGWPKMTMFFRLKDGSLADQVKEGDKVEFSLEKLASGYVISAIQKAAVRDDMKHTK